MRRGGALRAASARRAAAADRGSNAEGTARTVELQSATAASRGAAVEGARAAATQRRLQRGAIRSTARLAVGTTVGDGRPPPRPLRQGTPNGSGITANAGAQCTTHDPHGHLDEEERPCLLPCPPWQGAPSRQEAAGNEDMKLLISDPRGLAEGGRDPRPLLGQGRQGAPSRSGDAATRQEQSGNGGAAPPRYAVGAGGAGASGPSTAPSATGPALSSTRHVFGEDVATPGEAARAVLRVTAPSTAGRHADARPPPVRRGPPAVGAPLAAAAGRVRPNAAE